MNNYFENNVKQLEIEMKHSPYNEFYFIEECDRYIPIEQAETNRMLFVGIEMRSLKDIEDRLEGLNEKSLLFLYYRSVAHMTELLTRFDFEPYKEKVFFFAGDINRVEELNTFLYTLRTLSYTYTNFKPIIREIEDLEYIRMATHLIKTIREHRDNYEFLLGNNLDDTLYGIRNRLANLPNYVNNMGFDEFKDLAGNFYKGKPAVIVASGPSLDKNVALLKAYENKALILSCDGSMSSLAKHDIVPHVVGSVERGFRTYDVFYNNRTDDVLKRDIVFSGPAVVRPEIVDIFKDHKMISVFKAKEAYGQWLDDVTLNRKGCLWSGTSVAHFLYSFAEALGCSPIIFIGQDLAYSKEGLSHADDVEIKESVVLKQVEEWVTDYKGNNIPSTYIWKMFLLTFEDMIRVTPSKAIDATEGGAYIQGTEIMTFKEALETYCQNDLPRVSEFVKSYEGDLVYSNEVKQSVIKNVEGFIKDYEELLSRITQAVKLNKKALERFEKGIHTEEQLNKIYDAMDYVDNEIVKFVVGDMLKLMLFQYPIFAASRFVNAMDTSTYTLDSIKTNLHLHVGLLELMELYTKKFLYTINDALSETEDFYKGVEAHEQFMKTFRKKHHKIIVDKKYKVKYF